jgi:predicted regulator of Ras-like GTPase activity (Roadblock/LC7/MglB family)
MSIGAATKDDFEPVDHTPAPASEPKLQQPPSFFAPAQLSAIPGLSSSRPTQQMQQSEQAKPKKKQKKKKRGKQKDILKEITPQPFRGSIISEKGGYGAPPTVKELPQQRATSTSVPNSGQRQSIAPSSAPPSQIEPSVEKRQRLEEDMAAVVSSLSQTMKVPKKEKSEKTTPEKETPEEKIPPSSMNDILKLLLTIDSRIEASAIIKTDGTILASAISSRISDSLFATIGQNLSMIGHDIIDSLNSGILKSISIRGSEGVLDLAPVDKEHRLIKDMILMIFSHPNVKSGVLNMAISLLKKQIKDYLGIQDN